MNKWAKKLLLTFVSILAVLCAYVLIAAVKTRGDAKAQLNDFAAFASAKDPTTLFESGKRRYGSELRCNDDLCQLETKAVSNASIAWLHIVPYTEMKTIYTVYHGSLQWAMLDYRVAPERQRGAIVHIQQGMCNHGCGSRFDVNPHGTGSQDWNGLVEFDTRSTSEQRHAALSLNLGCFVRFGGCKDLVDLLPTMWSRVGAGTITSRMRGISQELEECHCLQPIADEF